MKCSGCREEDGDVNRCGRRETKTKAGERKEEMIQSGDQERKQQSEGEKTSRGRQVRAEGEET